MDNKNNIEKINLGGFPNILINNDIIKKKRETANIFNENNIDMKNILNIKDILKKK
jgi:hypothetical protein